MIFEVEEKIIKNLMVFNRPGTEELVKYLKTNGFFSSPASIRYHNSFEGGLAEHSYCVYKLFFNQVKKLDLNISHESVMIASILHDVCKMGAYNKNEGRFSWNYNNPKGHAKLSIYRIEKFIELTELEKNLIKFHMGFYGTSEFNTRGGEYSMKELTNASNSNPLISLFHWCDDFDAKFGTKYFKNNVDSGTSE